ncbi:MAG: hypothetical protein QW057_03530 [Candidatus Bathyarchaeia archaeon]
MRVVLTEAARRYLTRETGLADPGVFILQAECICGGVRPEISLRSKAEVSPVLLEAYFEEIASVGSASVFLDKRLKDHFGGSLTIDVDNAFTQLKLMA